MNVHKQVVHVRTSTHVTGRRTTGLDMLVKKYGLLPSQVEDVSFMMTQYKSNIVTIKRMLDWGLTMPQMETLFEVREHLSSQKDSISIRSLYKFSQSFDLELQTDLLLNMLDEIKRTWDPKGQKYLGVVLAEISRVGTPGLIGDPTLRAEFLMEGWKVPHDDEPV